MTAQAQQQYRRYNWNETETQALFKALASSTQGKTLEELAEAVGGTRTIEQVYCKLQNTRRKFKNDDPEIRRVLRTEFQKYQKCKKKLLRFTTSTAQNGGENTPASGEGAAESDAGMEGAGRMFGQNQVK